MTRLVANFHNNMFTSLLRDSQNKRGQKHRQAPLATDSLCNIIASCFPNTRCSLLYCLIWIIMSIIQMQLRSANGGNWRVVHKLSADSRLAALSHLPPPWDYYQIHNFAALSRLFKHHIVFDAAKYYIHDADVRAHEMQLAARGQNFGNLLAARSLCRQRDGK